MAESKATLDSYGGIDVELPDGSVRVCRVLVLSDALRFLRLLQRAREGSGQATLDFLDEFPVAVGLDDAEITPGEVFGLADRFFWSSRLLGLAEPTGLEGTTERGTTSRSPPTD